MTKEEQKIYWNEYNRKRKENHICILCGCQDERTLSGKVHCEFCATYEKKKQGERYMRLLSEKRCVTCGKQDENTINGYVRCAICMEKQRKNLAKYRAKKKELSI